MDMNLESIRDRPTILKVEHIIQRGVGVKGAGRDVGTKEKFLGIYSK